MENQKLDTWIKIAKEVASVVNKLPKNEMLTSKYIRDALVVSKCKYITPMCTFLNKKYKYGTPKNGTMVSVRLPCAPIHFSEFLNAIEDYNRLNSTNKHKSNIVDDNTFLDNSQTLKSVIQKQQCDVRTMSSFSDSEIVKELRGRGFEVIAKKVIEL